MAECELTDFVQAAGKVPEEHIDKCLLAPEAGKEGQVGVIRQTRLSPALQGNSSNEAISPSVR